MLLKPLACALLALPLAAQAQLSELSRDNNSGNLNNGYALAPADASGVQGSPFLLPEWLPSSVLLVGSKAPLAALLKYDIYRQELRAKRPAGDSIIVPLARVREFGLGSAPTRRFACFPAATLPAEVGGGCGELLYDNPAVQLLKFERKEIVKQAAENGGYVSTNTVARLETQTRYYLRYTADGRFVPLKPKRSSLEQALAGHPAALAALKARKSSIGNEAELAAAIAELGSSL